MTRTGDDNSDRMLTLSRFSPPPASSVGAAVLLLLHLLVILGDSLQLDVSTNQPETGMTLLI